jgi:Domain of unknown function (DUF4129)
MIVLVVCAAAPVLRAAQVDGGAMSVPEFASEIDRLIQRIDAAETAVAVAAVAASVPNHWRVALNEQRFDVDTAWLRASFQSAAARPETWNAQRAVMRRQLTEMRDEAAAAGVTVAGQPRPDARRALEQILARNEFQQSAASRWREQLQRRVGEWIEDLWTRFGGGQGAGRRVAIALAWIASIGALLALGFWMTRTIARRKPGIALDLGAGSVRRPRARELALRALSHARAGDVKEAVRAGYIAALVRLEEQGAWRVDDARTPREYLPLLRPADHRRELMLDLTRRFEQVWYGNRPAGQDEAARVTAHLEELGCLRPGERAI